MLPLLIVAVIIYFRVLLRAASSHIKKRMNKRIMITLLLNVRLEVKVVVVAAVEVMMISYADKTSSM